MLTTLTTEEAIKLVPVIIKPPAGAWLTTMVVGDNPEIVGTGLLAEVTVNGVMFEVWPSGLVTVILKVPWVVGL